MALINCPECGKEISDKVKACPHCGYSFSEKENTTNQTTEITDSNNQLEELKISKGKKFKSRIKIIIVAGLIIVLISLSYVIFTNMNPVGSFVNMVRKEKREEANDLYEKKIKDDKDKVEDTKEKLIVIVEKIYSQYYNENISYEDATEKLAVYEDYEISDSFCDEYSIKIDELKNSRDSYSSAVSAEKSGDYENAIKEYNAVIEDDPNYKTVATKVSDLKTEYKKQLKDEAAEYINNKKYDEAISNIELLISVLGEDDELKSLKEEYIKAKNEQYATITLVDKGTVAKDSSNWIFSNYITMVFDIVNNSDKVIVGIQGVLKTKDIFGVDILSMGCDFTGITIQAGETYREDKLSFECNEFMDTHMKLYNTAFSDLKYEYTITTIVFEDGTTVTMD